MFDPLNNVPKFDRLSQYLGLWAIEQTAFGVLLDRVRSMDVAAHMRQAVVNSDAVVEHANGIARIEIRGAMTKAGSSLSDAGSTVAIRREIRSAAADPSIGGIFLLWDTPGGTCAGTPEFYDDVKAAAAVKPVYSFIEDHCCSAGMFAAAGSTKIYANTPGAWVGSIGSIMGLYDMSGAAEKAGIVPVVISTGEFKSTGQPGLPITDAQKAMLQSLVNSMQALFTNAIKSRGLSDEQLAEVLTAKVYPASEGVRLRLIDGIKSEQEALAELQGIVTPSTGIRTMTTNAQAATLAELEAALPKAGSEFILQQIKANATLGTATGKFCELLQAQLAAANEKLTASAAEIDTLKAQVATIKGGTGKHETATDKPEDEKKTDAETPADEEEDDKEETPSMKWDRLVGKQVAKGIPKTRAASIVAKSHPQLRDQMISAANAGRGVRS